MLDKIKNYFFRRFIQSKTDYAVIVRHPTNYQNARSFGILVEAGNDESRAAAVRYAEVLRKDGKNVDIRGFVNTNDPIENFPFKAWNKKMLTWFGALKEEAAGQFWNTQYDFLIHLNNTSSTQLAGLAAISRAHLRIGAYHSDSTDSYDLMIDTGGSSDINHLIGQIDFYMKRVNTEYKSNASLVKKVAKNE